MKHKTTFFPPAPAAAIALVAALALLIAATAPATAQAGAAQPVVTYDLDSLKKTTIPIVIAGDPQLATHASKAFATHGAFTRVTAAGDYTLTFSPVSASQVRVEIAKKNSTTTPVITADGADTRDALFRAADAAVKHITGSPGFFTSRLAFVSNHTGANELYISDLFLNETRAITNLRSDTIRPHWSPDGRRIIFTSFFKTNSPDIFQIDVNTLAITNYAAYNGTNMGGRYSPDGSRVAMVIGIPGGNIDIYIGSPDARARPARVTSNAETKASPCFSPDGRRLVFAMSPGPQLHIMDAGGGPPVRLNTGGVHSAEPDWSRVRENLIVFTTNKTIGVHDLTTGKTRFITPKDASNRPIGGDFIEPAWLPDGRHIICTQRPVSGNQRFLHILDTDEKSASRATQISTLYAKQASVLPQP